MVVMAIWWLHGLSLPVEAVALELGSVNTALSGKSPTGSMLSNLSKPLITVSSSPKMAAADQCSTPNCPHSPGQYPKSVWGLPTLHLHLSITNTSLAATLLHDAQLLSAQQGWCTQQLCICHQQGHGRAAAAADTPMPAWREQTGKREEPAARRATRDSPVNHLRGKTSATLHAICM